MLFLIFKEMMLVNMKQKPQAGLNEWVTESFERLFKQLIRSGGKQVTYKLITESLIRSKELIRSGTKPHCVLQRLQLCYSFFRNNFCWRKMVSKM